MGRRATDGPAEPPEPGAAPWTRWPVGARVVVRRRVPGGWSDVLGDLLARDDEGVEVRTRRGDVRVPAAEIGLGKLVPPAPVRRHVPPDDLT